MASKRKTAVSGPEPAVDQADIAPPEKGKKRVKTAENVTQPADAGKKRKKVPASRKKRHPKAKRPTQAEMLLIEERQNLVFELVKAGTSFRKISAHLKSKGYPASVGTVHADLQAVLARGQSELDIDVSQWLKIELGTLGELQSTFFVEALKNKDPEAASVVLRILRERDRYLGISKAQQSDSDAAAALAKLLGVDPEDLPDGDGASTK
jgi:hypothetical protein